MKNHHASQKSRNSFFLVNEAQLLKKIVWKDTLATMVMHRNKHLFPHTVVQVTIRVGTLGYDLGPAICDTCQKAS